MSTGEGLVANLRAWRETTPDAWILHAADQIERLERELAASQLHARTLNRLLGAADDDNARLVLLLRGLLDSARRNERDHMPSEWREAVEDAEAYLLARSDGSRS
jgi:hypothetical protein